MAALTGLSIGTEINVLYCHSGYIQVQYLSTKFTLSKNIKEVVINSGRNSLHLKCVDSRRRIACEQAIVKIRNAEAAYFKREM